MYFMFYEPTVLLHIPALLLAVWAQYKVKVSLVSGSLALRPVRV